MSVYGYNRRTTPHLERLAAEGAVFEHAYSNSSWTQVSVTSFMTSLHNSVLGATAATAPPSRAGRHHGRAHAPGRLPDRSPDVQPLLRPLSGLDRGVDIIRDADPEQAEKKPAEAASTILTGLSGYPGRLPGPALLGHFQPTTSIGLEAGRVVRRALSTLEERKVLDGIFEKMSKIQWMSFDDRSEVGVDRALFWQLSGRLMTNAWPTKTRRSAVSSRGSRLGRMGEHALHRRRRSRPRVGPANPLRSEGAKDFVYMEPMLSSQTPGSR